MKKIFLENVFRKCFFVTIGDDICEKYERNEDIFGEHAEKNVAVVRCFRTIKKSCIKTYF
ncbi:MAG: hypothetical protein LBL77_01595 [Endomicrobium sp.]|jgi:hypothetical protein|nr:hypothetical protein [Endomicrobium sp.]